MWLQVRLYLLLGFLLAIIYGVIVGVGSAIGAGSLLVYVIIAVFFVNDPSRAMREVSELKDVDLDMSGTIDYGELLALQSKSVRLTTGAKIMEMMTTHPNMLKRIKHLSSLI